MMNRGFRGLLGQAPSDVRPEAASAVPGTAKGILWEKRQIFLSPRGQFAQISSMSNASSDTPSELGQLLLRAAAGDPEAWRVLFDRDRNRLRRMVAVRLDRRLQGRVDPSDVIQDAHIEAMTRLPEYLRQPTLPFFLWLRLIVGQRLMLLHRRHLGTQARDACREIGLYHGALPEATSAALAARLLGHLTRPSEAAVRTERKIRVQTALNAMDALDREILALRHFEQLSNGEVAQALGLSASAASKRYVRAVHRLREILAAGPGELSEL
jgi:RNA polymerase sigma-70 factor (ECF subfamily)